MMIDKNQLRGTIFKHLDGLATAPIAVTLSKKGILDFLLEKKEAFLSEIAIKFNANEGYLNVGLRILASQGFLDYAVNNNTDEIKISTNAKSKIAFSFFYLYDDVVDLLHFSSQFHPRIFEDEPFQKLNTIFDKYMQNYRIEFSNHKLTLEIQQQILVYNCGDL